MAWLAPRFFWAVIPLAVLAAGFLVRVFIIFHDCGHGSFTSSRRANQIIGFITGTLTFVPSHFWWQEHSRHHATSGNLDRRGTGDIWTMTVREYQESSRWQKLAYRGARNPFVLFVIAPFFVFVVKYRFTFGATRMKERVSVHCTNLAILGVAVAASLLMGFGTYLLIQSLILVVSGAAGIWLFYVQHQFEDVYWERGERWAYAEAALQGSSYYRLPKVLQWFTGNIGFHHIHHLNPAVPNYHLERMHRSDAKFERVRALTLRASLRSLRFRLWDETKRKLVGYPRQVPEAQ